MSKTELQPKDYRFVVFSDEAAKFSFLTRSTAKSEETIKWTDGKEYPLVKIQISSKSHPFFTGEEKIIDTEGRVDRFKARAKKAEALRSKVGNKIKKAEAEAKKKAEKAEKAGQIVAEEKPATKKKATKKPAAKKAEKAEKK